MRATHVVLACAALLVMATLDESMTAEAIVRLDGVSDAKYVVDPAKYPGIVPVNNYFTNCPNGKNTCIFQQGKMKGKMKTIWNVSCAGTVIGRKHIISARHCFCRDGNDFGYTAGFWVWVAGERYKVKRTMVPPGCGWTCASTGHPNQCDIAIMELEKPIRAVVDGRVKPYPIYDHRKLGSEVGKTIEFYGWGVTGTAGKTSGHTCDTGILDRKFRRGMNTVLDLGRDGTSWGRHPNHVLKFMMRGGSNPAVCKNYKHHSFMKINQCKPGPGLPLEAISASGDSGTPAFIRDRHGRMYLAGINSAGDKTSITSLDVCGYGAIDEFSRVSKFTRFIRNVLRGDIWDKPKRNDKFHRKVAYYTMPYRKPHWNFSPYGHELGGASRRRAKDANMQCKQITAVFWKHKIDMLRQRLCHAIGTDFSRWKNRAKKAFKKLMAAKANKSTKQMKGLFSGVPKRVASVEKELKSGQLPRGIRRAMRSDYLANSASAGLNERAEAAELADPIYDAEAGLFQRMPLRYASHHTITRLVEAALRDDSVSGKKGGEGTASHWVEEAKMEAKKPRKVSKKKTASLLGKMKGKHHRGHKKLSRKQIIHKVHKKEHKDLATDEQKKVKDHFKFLRPIRGSGRKWVHAQKSYLKPKGARRLWKKLQKIVETDKYTKSRIKELKSSIKKLANLLKQRQSITTQMGWRRRASPMVVKQDAWSRAVGRTAHGPKLMKGKLWPFTDTARCGKSFPCPHLRSIKLGMGGRPMKFSNGKQTTGRRCHWTGVHRRVKDKVVLQALRGAGKMVDAMLSTVLTATGKVTPHWEMTHNLLLTASYTQDKCHETRPKKKLSVRERARRARHAGRARGHKRFYKLCKKHGLHSCAKRHHKLWKKHSRLARGRRDDYLVQMPPPKEVGEKSPMQKAREAKSKKAKKNKGRYLPYVCRRRRTFDKAGNPVPASGRGVLMMRSRQDMQQNIAVAPGPIGFMVEMSKSITGSNRGSTRRLRRMARGYARRWLLPYARFIRTRKFPSLRKLLQVMIWLHDLGQTRVLKRTKRVADRVYRRVVKKKACKICWLVGDVKAGPRLALELAKGKLPREIKHNDLAVLLHAVSDLERANFIFGDSYDVGFGLYDLLVYLRRYRPKVKGMWSKKPGRGFPSPVKQYQQMCKQRGGCWLNAHVQAMDGFGSIKNTLGFMTKLPLALDSNGAVALQRSSMPWVFKFYEQWMPALLRGRFVTMLGHAIDQYRQAGYTERNNPMVCWGSTVLMKLHRGNGWFYPAHYSIGKSAMGKFQWTAAALAGLHNRRPTVDPAYARYMAALLKKARFATQDKDADTEDYDWKTNHEDNVEKKVEQSVVRNLITKKKGNAHKRQHGRREWD